MKKTKVIVAILIVLLVIGWGIVASNDDTRNSDESNIINERIRFGIYLGDDSTQLHITDECMALHPAVHMKKIIIIAFSVCILLVAVPLGMKYANKIHQEELFTQSVKAAMDYYDEYQKSEDEAELDKLIAELENCHDILRDMETDSEHDLFSSEVASAVIVLQKYKGNAQGLEQLEKGLNLIQEDVYSDAGYSMLLEFVNDNIGDEDAPKVDDES